MRRFPPTLFRIARLTFSSFQLVYVQYKQLFSEWRRERDLRDRTECAAGAPGSPTKSPSKTKAWSGSSKNQKEALLQLSRRFWSLVVDHSFKSPQLQGPAGAANVRVLVVSSSPVAGLDCR